MTNMMKRNDLEILQEEYPEVKQMTFNNVGFDYLMYNSFGVPVKIEYKYRSKNVKYDITSAQTKEAEIFTLRTSEDKHYHMLASTYINLSKPHSALASGWTGKERELSQKKFIENSTKDLRILVEQVENKDGNLMDFI